MSSRQSLIRVQVDKPMGIVFEPIPPKDKKGNYVGIKRSKSQEDMGARVKTLIKDGSAAKTGKIKIGDELLCVEDDFTTGMTFDDIMDQIVRNKNSLSLLFHRTVRIKKEDNQIKDTAPIPSTISSESGVAEYKDPKTIEEIHSVIEDAHEKEGLPVAEEQEKAEPVVEKIEENPTLDDIRGNPAEAEVVEVKTEENRGLVSMLLDTFRNPCGRSHPEHATVEIAEDGGYVFSGELTKTPNMSSILRKYSHLISYSILDSMIHRSKICCGSIDTATHNSSFLRLSASHACIFRFNMSNPRSCKSNVAFIIIL